MKVLLTGANGFLGSHVAQRLADLGVDLRLMLRSTSNTDSISGLRYERVEGDVRDPSSLARAVEGVDVVVHMAVLNWAVSEAIYQSVNAVGTGNLVHAARNAGVRRFVYISSLAAQGPNPDATTMMPQPPAPISAYGRSKLAGETAVLAARGDLDVTMLRPGVIYGPRDTALLPFFRMGKLGFLPVYGDGLNTLSWIHVDDAASAVTRAALEEVASGSIFTISDGSFHTWRRLVEAFGRAWGKTPRIIPVPGWAFTLAGIGSGAAQTLSRRSLTFNPDQVRHMRARYWICDNAAITAALGWQPQVDLDEGMSNTVRWYRDHHWL